MNKLLIIYNTCGIENDNNINIYINHINSLLLQNLSNIKIVISSCLNSNATRQALQKFFGNHISYCWIDSKIPVNPSFNHTVIQSIKLFGNFEGYMYVDSGIKFNDRNDISNLYHLLLSGPYSIVSAQTNDDIGFHYEKKPDLSKDYIIPIGKSVNCHAQIFSHKYFSFYKKLLPDIFAGHCSESVLSFCCSAIQTKWIVSSKVIASHREVDGQSAGFKPLHYIRRTGKQTWDHPFMLQSLLPIFMNSQAISLGLGYEECRGIVMHDASQFDDNGYCKNNKLKFYIKNNLFLSNNIFNYNNIQSEFIQ